MIIAILATEIAGLTRVSVKGAERWSVIDVAVTTTVIDGAATTTAIVDGITATMIAVSGNVIGGKRRGWDYWIATYIYVKQIRYILTGHGARLI